MIFAGTQTACIATLLSLTVSCLNIEIKDKPAYKVYRTVKFGEPRELV